jgi:hypothetical protein
MYLNFILYDILFLTPYSNFTLAAIDFFRQIVVDVRRDKGEVYLSENDEKQPSDDASIFILIFDLDQGIL